MQPYDKWVIDCLKDKSFRESIDPFFGGSDGVFHYDLHSVEFV